MMKTYKVQKNDTLWGIAKKHLGSGERYKDIMVLNGMADTLIKPGMVLKIPTVMNYEAIGRAYVQAMKDSDGLESVKKLYALLGD